MGKIIEINEQHITDHLGFWGPETHWLARKQSDILFLRSICVPSIPGDPNAGNLDVLWADYLHVFQ